MGSILSTGYYREQAEKTRKSKCAKAPGKKREHKWKEYGSWPSQWWECKHCKITIYDK